jgi:glycosyltransferase involved in cell wall biosynthesis
MKILWQNEHYPDTAKGGGGAMKTSYIAPLLQSLGHKTVILARGPDGQGVVEEKVNGVPVIRLSPPRMPDRLWPLWPLLEPLYLKKPLHPIAETFDAFVFVDSAYGVTLKRLFPRRPVICRVEGTRKSYRAAVHKSNSPRRTYTEHKRGIPSEFLAREHELMDRAAWKKSDALLVESEFLKRDLVELYGVDPEKICVVPNGVDYERFANARPSSETLGRVRKNNNGTIVITFCGRLAPMKNVRYLVQGFARMKFRDRCVLMLVGDGVERDALMEDAKRLDVSALVRFIGHTTHVEEFLAASDIFVLPSSFEPFGNVLLEAMAAGLPSVALRPDFLKVRTAGAEHISDGETGYLVDGSDPLDLASKLDLLSAEPATRQRMGEAAQILCRTKYSWENCAPKYIDLVQRIAYDLKTRMP